MPGLVRRTQDKHVGHASPTPNPHHATPYVVAGQTKVSVEGDWAVLGASKGSTSCGDNAVGCSSLVTIEGTGVHRIGDSTSGHPSWPANSAATGSSLVTAN